MNQIEVPFYEKSLKVTYTTKGLVEVKFQNKKLDSMKPSNDSMAKRIRQSLSGYLSGKIQNLDISIDWDCLQGTEFQKKVWKKMQKIPYGKVKTYGQIAKDVGSPRASQAVGSACGKNHVLLFIPCHRVVGSTGLGGFSAGGLPIKRKLLDLENYQY